MISRRDPGVANWLDPCGRVEGTLVFRNYRAKNAVVPSSRKVDFAKLDSLLPKGTRRVSPSARQKLLARRRSEQVKLYGE